MADCLCSGLGMMTQDYFPNSFENVVVQRTRYLVNSLNLLF